MSDILSIKTSSLGDVIHHMPALTDARRQWPQARFCWVVEEAFAPLVRIHPAVADVIPVASRRWRGRLLASAPWRGIPPFGARPPPRAPPPSLPPPAPLPPPAIH